MLQAFVDESGTRDLHPKSSDHFVMSAVVIDPSQHGLLEEDLLKLKSLTGRLPEHEITFKRLDDKHRATVATYLGQLNWPTVVSVVVCKRELENSLPNDTDRYLYTLKLLLERLSWLARDNKKVMHYTLAHIKGMKLQTLRSYEAFLRQSDSTIAWKYLTNNGGKLDQPKRLAGLQIADLVASSTGIAFNASPRSGRVHPEYFEPLFRHLYNPTPGKLTSYGLKMHPWNLNTKATYPWVVALCERHVA